MWDICVALFYTLKSGFLTTFVLYIFDIVVRLGATVLIQFFLDYVSDLKYTESYLLALSISVAYFIGETVGHNAQY